MSTQTGIPGQRAAIFTAEKNIFWGGMPGQIQVLRASSVISSLARDAGNTPTTTLRAGLLMGKITASGELLQYVEAAIDGSEVAYSVLEHDVDVLENAVATDQFTKTVVSAPVRVENLLIEGLAFVGATDEAAARVHLNLKRFYLNDEFV